MRTAVLIIGAGPYGVAVAQALWERGVDFTVVGEPFALWRRHTLAGMLLRSDQNFSELYSRDSRYGFARLAAGGDLTVERIGGQMTVASFRRYLERVQAQLPFPIVETLVARLERQGDGFVATCADGATVAARAVVIATGIGAHRHLPEAVARLDPARVLHSWDTAAIEALAGQRVLVLGSGQSAAESVDCLRAGNAVTWAVRRPPAFFMEPLRLPTPLFKLVLSCSPAFYYLPRPLLLGVAGSIFRPTITPNLRPTWSDPAVRRVVADAAGLGLRDAADGVACTATAERYDTIVAATGYRFSLRGLPFLAPPLEAALGGPDTTPPLDRTFQTPVPRLYMTGGIAESAFGPAQRFIMGSWYAARQLGRALAGL